MNCKPGDLAIVIRSLTCPHNVGKVVRVLKPAYGHVEPAWWFEPSLPGNLGGTVCGCFDSCLRPIRDNNGQDETLQWVEKPEAVVFG